MDKINDRYGMDLRQAGDINKKRQEYTKELYKKDLQFSSVQSLSRV